MERYKSLALLGGGALLGSLSTFFLLRLLQTQKKIVRRQCTDNATAETNGVYNMSQFPLIDSVFFCFGLMPFISA
ncbi:hypothetical protein L195_g054483 [Trifolium pratense]|uniref:Uncharacterized protein n=1 Tax=Trifolium pratense TaxID=57577 RepID=A0A2K3KGA6_TRIPR|nr:hypothetical protein L195_g054483 [Trifolium pratense]